jgi:LmbE family N-acetylglucosaminyl deacetylase
MLDFQLAPRSDRPLRILCVGAHCDDIEIGCGGYVRRLLREHPAAQVRWVVFSGNEEREREARAAAADFLTGAGAAQVDVLDFRESFFPDQWAAIKEHFEVIRRDFEPDCVLTHHQKDRHQDHRVLAELAWNTFRNHLILEYEIPKYDADLGRPNVFVPLSQADAAHKVRSIREHFRSQSERAWFDEETFWALLRLRGLECNAPEKFAEGFHVSKLRI